MAKKLIAAKLKHEKLTAQITAIRRRLREAKHNEQRAAKRDERMAAKGRKLESEASRALRASQIAKDEKRLETAIAAAHAIFEERVRLTAIWKGSAGNALKEQSAHSQSD